MGRVIVNPQAALFGGERRQVTPYGRDTLADMSNVVGLANQAVTLGSKLGDVASPIITGIYNMSAEDKARMAGNELAGLQRQGIADRSAAAREMMGNAVRAEEQRPRFDRAALEKALPPPIVQPQIAPEEQSSMMTGMMQPGYKNPYGMRLNTPEADARARAADLMLGGGAFGQVGAGGGLEAFDAKPLDWSHQAPVDRRSVAPKYAPQNLLRGLPAFIDKVAPPEEVIPPGIFGANPVGAQQMPQPGTPEFRAMIAQQEPTAEAMSAGFGDSAMKLLRRVTGGAPAATARPAVRRAAAPSLQQRANQAQQEVAQQIAASQQQAQQEIAPAQAEMAQGIAQSEQSTEALRQNMLNRQPNAAEAALAAQLASAQGRSPVEVEQFDYSIPQLEALIIQAKQSGDPETINKVAAAINASSLRGARAASVFGDIVGGGHIARERQRLLGSLSGIATRPESVSDLAGELSKAQYQRILGSRMEDKPLEFIAKQGLSEGGAALKAGKTGAQVRQQAASAVAQQEAAQKAAATTALAPSQAAASNAQKYASAANSWQSVQRSKALTPLDAALKWKKINELPKESKGISFTFNGARGDKDQMNMLRKVRDEAAQKVGDLPALMAQLGITENIKGMDRKQAAAYIAKQGQEQKEKFAQAVLLSKIILDKRRQLGDAAINGIRLDESIGLTKDMVDALAGIEEAAKLPQAPAATPATSLPAAGSTPSARRAE